MKTSALLLFAAFALACGEKAPASGAADSSAERPLHVLVWTDYLVPDVKAEFEKEFHARIFETNFSNNEELRSKLLEEVSSKRPRQG